MMATVEDTKRRGLEAAGREFAEKGLDGASIRSICARAGANVSAVNYYFGDKENLYVQAVIEAHRCGVIRPPDLDPTEREPAEQLREYIRHFLNGIMAVDQSEGWHHDLLLRELVRPSKASETLVREVIRPRFETLTALVGRICPQADQRRRHAI